ncbi:MAG: CPBP family intramembrane metalloprotease [Roseofilum sp. SBFL]|uniref:CPBP family intramembrane glutamic endopeptidase n=1 Tax=unclassified Roseofilum TaxID=2620099 RepID=UPI001B1E9B21|nr:MULTISPECIES: type II CAAX endopeptidase family protein [unclassified Roseofilum]MBP0012878.1 CPBP family intramembrane metalloprotease [Roseofilum sp. SID3]MBP0025538.1 CPBP family intramembrane metalloprotease [Roseofilum sp. SID2]MBP0037973.1 CPBP family intramembrane metalloprotease [Roseofilum sp. SID1]MBP0041621.1 CPBP family intramembrane metalloprotease [Roseofilum sp. SBFL]
MQRILRFLVVLLCVWLPIALPIYLWVRDPNWQSILAMGILYIEFLLLVYVWSRWVDPIPHLGKYYGVSLNRANRLEFFAGLWIAVSVLLGLFTIQELMGWVTWRPLPPSMAQVILEAILIGFGVGCAEELFFRGWFLSELQRDYSPNRSAWINTLIFAVLHFIKPLGEILRTWVQFPGLVLLGLTLVWAKYATYGRLGLSIGLHGGLVATFYVINVGQLIEYTQTVPPWITGIDQNPLAGMMGILCLSGIGFWVRRRSRRLLKGSNP